MPNGPVNDEGQYVLFSDTGPVPDSSNYTTLVIVHGTSFNSGTFSRLPSIGSKHGMRTVLFTRRDYRGSSLYSDDDLALLQAGKKEFLEGVGKNLAHFLLWFIKSHDIPKASIDRKSGGIALMGWSMGNHVTLSLLGHPDAISKDKYLELGSYLRRLIVYDPPFTSLGYPIPTNGYHPFRDPNFTTLEAKVANFGVWVSEYYVHPGYDSRNLLDLDFRTHGDDPSVKHVTQEEREQMVEKKPVDRVDLSLVFKMQSELGNQTQRALFDPELAKTVLPGLPVTFFACKSSNWYCVYSFFESENRYKKLVSEGNPARPITFVELPGANHFVHWDNPNQLMDNVQAALDS